MKGKVTIYPLQTEVIKETFLPSPQEMEEAKKIIEPFEEAVARGSAVTSLNGRMIDTPVAERARKLSEVGKKSKDLF